jgi:hypothetical protein
MHGGSCFIFILGLSGLHLRSMGLRPELLLQLLLESSLMKPPSSESGSPLLSLLLNASKSMLSSSLLLSLRITRRILGTVIDGWAFEETLQ